MEFTLVDLVTVISLVVIIGASFYFNQKIDQYEKSGKLIDERRYIEQRPTVASTLGVLGTFIGITIGLIFFNPKNINDSIPELLSGLKTAFFTSLAGMVSSMILGKKVNALYDKYDKEQHNVMGSSPAENMNHAAGLIVDAVKSLLEQSKKDSQATQSALKTLCEKIDENTLVNKELKQEVSSVGDKTEYASKAVIASLEPKLNDINDSVKSVSTTLETQVVDIENKMSNTNQLLTNKFDEFSELLKKSNTEALVDVMKKVTDEFQKSMNELIGRLVKENFDQLNKSVNQLNEWQQENKQMIASLTQQYQQMETDFEGTSTTLVKVGEDTKNLVADGGRLQQLITALSNVMVDDQRFQDMTIKLTNTVDLTKSSMESFEEATNHLNDWLTKQKHFAEKVDELLVKLQEIEKIKDYGGQFWQETKQKMEEGVGIIAQGSKNLGDQIQAHDSMFYNRLNNTLSELDSCISAFMEGNGQQ